MSPTDENNDSLRVEDVRRRAERELARVYGEREAKAIVRVIFEAVTGWGMTELILKADYRLNDFTRVRVMEYAGRVAAGEPVQQVVGWADFCGMRFKVTRDTLIPRPETAILVDMIVKDAGGRKDLRVLDCGTGSGCIAISLARMLPFARVEGIDISEAALTVARENARELHVDVGFRLQDMLAMPAVAGPRYDIIASNPPYIAESERAQMERNVLDYEPAQALFVPDDDPLRFYLAVGRYASAALCPGGRLYFEINPLYAAPLREAIAGLGFSDVTILPDDRRRQRFLTARR